VSDVGWIWRCPTCGDHGFVRGEYPTFSRCLKCDSSAPRGNQPPPLEIHRTFDTQQLLEDEHELALIEVIQIIEAEMDKTARNTGHGKAQRAFGRKLLERLKPGESSPSPMDDEPTIAPPGHEKLQLKNDPRTSPSPEVKK
jgi:hypothetical protein